MSLSQPNQQPKTTLKTILVGVVLVSIRKPQHTTTRGMITIRQPKKLILGIQLYFNPTRRNMKDYPIFVLNEIRPHFF
jgi:hypothetical protein